MQTINDVHRQFAEFFNSDILKPYAYMASKRLSEGHICIRIEEVNEDNNELPPRYREMAEAKETLGDESLVSITDEKQPFVLHNGRFYIQRYYQYETDIFNRLRAFVEEEKTYYPERKALLEADIKSITKLFSAPDTDENSDTTDWQLVAAINAVLNSFTIITGGPGTGKTTTVAKILAILFKSNTDLKVALAAPTGKAAARMAESLSNAELNADTEVLQKIKALEPSTVHRLLGYRFDSPNFKHDQTNTLSQDVIIVDESSMLDAALFAKLLNAIGKGTRLIMLGDKDQLASVEAGSLFGDLCNSLQPLNLFSKEDSQFINQFIKEKRKQLRPEIITESVHHPLFQHIVELKYSRRFSDTRGIGKFSKAVINNDQAMLRSLIEKQEPEVKIDAEYSEQIFSAFIGGYKNYIKEERIEHALQKLNNVRVLCAVKEGGHGLYKLNRQIEKLLQEEGLIELNSEFYHNRPVMITRNYYDLNLFNGDTGIIREEGGVMKVFFPDAKKGIKSVPPAFVADSETVFAMTIHKSQGSEFDRVLLRLPDSPDIPILTRELIYTGVTRAKSNVTIQATEAVILESAKRQVKRASGIRESFLEDV